jgi:hypothetical protein
MAIASDYQIPAIQPTPMETAGKNGSGKFAEGAVGHVCFSCVRQVQQIDHVERVLVGFQVNSSIPLFDRK